MRTLLTYMILLVLPVLGYAQTWTGNVSNSWHEPGNWDGNSVPASNATVNIRPVGSNPYPVITQDVTVQRINLSEWSGGGDLTVTDNATLTVNDRFDINNHGHLFLHGGHLEFNGPGNDQHRINMGYTNTLIRVAEGGSLTSTQDRLRVNGEVIVEDGSIDLLNGLQVNTNKFFRITTGDVTIYGETSIGGRFEGGAGNIVFDGNPSNNQHTVTIRSSGRLFMAPSSFDDHPPDCPENTPDPPPLSGGTIDFLIESSVENNGRLWGGDAVITYHKASESQGDAITEIHNGVIIFKDDATFSNTASLNITCKGSVFVEGDGTFEQNGMMDVGQGTLTVSGNAVFQNTGILYGGDGNITFEDNVLIAGSGGAIYAENSTINFNGGTFDHSGTFDPGTSTFIFGADGDQEVIGSNNLITFYNLVVEEGADVQSSQNVLVLNDMEVEEDGFFDVDDGLTINVIGDVTGHPNVDTNRPYIIALFIIDDTTINVVFNETLDQGTAENTSNYRIDDQIIGGTQIGTIVNAALGGANNNEVTLELNLSTSSGIIEQGENYILVVNNVENPDGRSVSQNHRKRFGYPNFLAFELRYYPGGLDKTNLQLWLDAADPDFMFTDFSGKQKAGDGDPVAFWVDKSGNNRNALQSDESMMPVLTYDLAIGGRPSLTFDNAEFLVFDGSFVAGSDYSIASLVARSSSKSLNVYLGGNDRGANLNLHVFWSTSTRLNHHHWGNDYFANVPPFDGSLAGEIHVVDYNQATSPHRHLYRNGELLNTHSDHRPMLNWQGSAIGRYVDPNSSSHSSKFEGYVSEMIMHNKRLSESERIIIENYKAAKWGQELAASSKKFDAPEGFTYQLAGIGRDSSADIVEETIYTSGGMGFSNSNPGFLSNDGNYLMAAHNNVTGVDSVPYFTGNHILMKWSRAWYVEITRPGSEGTLDIYFDLDDYGLSAPAPGAEYMIIYHPEDPNFPAAGTMALSAVSSISGTKVAFSLSSEDIANGYYTIGEYIAPAIADPGQTTISAVPTVIEADGISESVITVQARYFTGDPLVTGGDMVELISTAGSLSAVTDNGDGTYTAILTSTASEGTAEISGTINSELIDGAANVVFKFGAADPGETTIAADPVFIVADGVTSSLITVKARDKQGNALIEGGDLITLSTTAGTLSAFTDNGNGTYTALLTSETTAQMAIISGTINAAPILEQTTVTFTPGAPDPQQTTLFAFPPIITANGHSTATIIVQAIDEFGNSLTTGGDLVTISTTAGTLNSVTDNSEGSYAALLTSSEAVETAIITATINGSELNETATVEFVDYIVLNYYPGGLDNSDLQLWFDARDPEVLFTDVEGNIQAEAGDRIGHWRDKSIFGRNATQATYALRPLLDGTNGFGGRPSLFFDDAEFLLFDGTFAANTNYTVNAVVSRTSDKEYNIYLGGTETGANNNLHLFWSGSNRLHYHHFLNDFNVGIPPYDGSQQGEWHMFRFSGNEDTPARRIFRNGVFLESLTSAAALNDWQGASIGRYMPRGGDFFEGRMAELIFYGYPLNNTERVIIGNYTAARWGYPLDAEITFYDPPGNFDQQLVGIGRFSAADLVSETAFTSGGLGFRANVSGFLAGINNYMMAAHNGETGIANELLYLGDEYIERWQRSWYLKKTAPNGDGLIQLYFNTFDYDESYPARRDDFYLLYHPGDPEFPEASTEVVDADAILEGVEVRFAIHSSQLNDGYYTLGRLSRGVTYYSRTTGPWNDTDTWSLISHSGIVAGQLPGEDDQVIIGANHVVTLVEHVTNETGSILISSSGTLVTNQQVIEGGGRFILEPDGTLHIGSTDGILASAMAGNIQTSIRNFSSQANYVYDGVLPQQTGDGLPAQIQNLRIDNPLGVIAVASLTVNGQLQLDNGLFSMPPGSSLVANDVEQTNGNMRMQLTIDGGKGWRMITSPVQTDWADLLDNFVSQGFPGSSFPDKQPNLLWFDEEEIGTTNMAWRVPENMNSPVTGGLGYFHYVFNGAEILENGDSSGVFYNDVLPITMDATGLEHASGPGFFDFDITYSTRYESNITDTDIPEMNTGWNLIGNPSTASLDWDNAEGWTKEHIDDVIYIWDPEANNGEGEFLFWNGNAGTLDNGLISPFQSFWVRANDENPALAMNSDAKTTGGSFVGNSFSGKSQLYYVPTSLMLKLEAGGMETYAMLSFTENGQMGEDPGDAYRLEPLGSNWLKLYTSTSEHHMPMVLNNLPAFFENPLIIPLYYEGERQGKPVGGEYRLSWTMPENWPLHWETVLMDHANKKVIPMDKQTNTIQFFTNETYSSAPIEDGAADPSKLPDRIVSQQAEHIAYDMPLPAIKGNSNADEGTVSIKQSSTELAPAFSIVIFTIVPPEEIEYIHQKPTLITIYPNPVTDIANIQFSLPEHAQVEFRIYDIYGRRLHHIASQMYGPGVNHAHWSSDNLKSGVYVIEMRSGDYKEAQRVIVH